MISLSAVCLISYGPLGASGSWEFAAGAVTVWKHDSCTNTNALTRLYFYQVRTAMN